MRDYPAIKLTLFFIAGILVQKIFRCQIELLLVVSSLLILLVVLILRLKNQNEFLKFLFAALSIVLAGQIHLALNQIVKTQYPFTDCKINDVKISGEVEDISLLNDKRMRIIISAANIERRNDEIPSAPVIVLCTVYDDSTKFINRIYSQLQIGNKVEIIGDLKKARERRNPGEFDYYQYLLSQNINTVMNVYSSGSIKILDKNTNQIPNLIFEIRKSIDRLITKFHSKEAAALLRGLLLADRSQIEYDLVESFINAGVVHVLAVSGLNVAYVVMVFIFLFGRFNTKFKITLSIAGICFYLVITTGPASVFRACLMAVFLMISQLTSRTFSINNSLAVSALVLLIIDPCALFDPGFQLSYSAVISIVYLYPKLKKFIEELKIKYRFLQNFLLFTSISVAAQIGTLPFTLIYFHKISIIALFANIIVIPVTGILNASVILTVILGSIWPWVGNIYGAANSLMTEWLFIFIRFAGRLDFSYLRINQFSLYDFIIYYMGLYPIIMIAMKAWSRKSKIIMILIVGVSILVYSKLDDSNLLINNKLTVFSIDVGQGDAALINFPDGTTALVDAGNCTQYFDNGGRVIKPLLERLGIEKIDFGIVSHIDSDHYGGFISLTNEGIIKKIIKPAPDSSSRKDIDFENLLMERNIPFEYFSKRRIRIANCNLYFLNDTAKIADTNFDSNNRSGVLKIVYGNTSFLFVGDLGVEGEEKILQDFGGFVKADYLKVGHHGSKTSSSESFIDAVKPKIGIICAGLFNNFNHPSPVILQRLAERNIHIERTDYDGGILYVSDGKKIEKIDWKNLENNILQN